MKKIFIILLFAINFCSAQKVNFWALNTNRVHATNSGTIHWLESSPSGYTSSSSACANGGVSIALTVYWNGSFANGTYLYTSPSGDNIMTTSGLGGYYTSGTTWLNNGTNNQSFQLLQGLYGQYYIANLTTCTVPPYYTNSTGTYPTIGGAGTSSTGTVTNNSGATIYLYAVYNSGGATSGTASFSYGYGPSWTEGGTITSGGQTFIGANYQTLLNGTSVTTLSLTKNDAVGTGAGVRWAYSTTVGGSLTVL